MKNYIEMRPHHLLCLPGYKGISYDKAHATSWDRISKSLAEYPDMRVKIVMTQDTLCKKCPKNAENKASCDENWTKMLDEKVRNFLSLDENIIYRYDEILNKAKALLNPKNTKDYAEIAIGADLDYVKIHL